MSLSYTNLHFRYYQSNTVRDILLTTEDQSSRKGETNEVNNSYPFD